jgi:hypothetical protein
VCAYLATMTRLARPKEEPIKGHRLHAKRLRPVTGKIWLHVIQTIKARTCNKSNVVMKANTRVGCDSREWADGNLQMSGDLWHDHQFTA